MKKRSKPARIPEKSWKDIDRALDNRVKNGLIKRRKATTTEFFRLADRTPEWKNLLKKIEKYPKKEDLYK